MDDGFRVTSCDVTREGHTCFDRVTSCDGTCDVTCRVTRVTDLRSRSHGHGHTVTPIEARRLVREAIDRMIAEEIGEETPEFYGLAEELLARATPQTLRYYALKGWAAEQDDRGGAT